MKRWRKLIGIMLLWAQTGGATEVPLGSIPLSVMLTNLPKITVETPRGGWYDRLALSNSAGSDTTRFQVQAPVQVSIRNGRDFMVSLVKPLVLTHESKTALTFTTEQVAFGSSKTTLQTLSANPVNFSNQTLVGKDSTGLYLLSVSARQPVGGRDAITGQYIGQLVLMFEVKV